jgi:hypothetical protein
VSRSRRKTHVTGVTKATSGTRDQVLAPRRWPTTRATCAPAQGPGVDPSRPAERGPSVRWNLRLSTGLRDRIKARVKARGLQDREMVEELLWLALSWDAEGSDRVEGLRCRA